jgi:hypothetical protein
VASRLHFVDVIVFGILLGLVAITLGFAWWQNRKAVRARQALSLAVEELPSKVVDALRFIVRFNQEGSTIDPVLSEPWHGAIDYVDVNEDGQKELLVQYPTGAHGSALRVLAWQNGKLEELAALGVGTPVGFEFGDFDGDGRVEIRTQETDWSVGLPYVRAPRSVLLLRWNGTKFVEVSRKSPVAGSSQQ